MRIRQLVPGLLVLLLGDWVHASGLHAQALAAGWTPELALTIKRVGSVAISPDGRWAAVEVSEPVMEAELSEWRPSVRVYSLGGAGARPRMIEAPASAPAWSPDGSAIAFSHSPSPSGDDWVRSDVSVVEVATGRVRPLAATPAAEGGVAWSPDGRWIALTVSDAPATYALTAEARGTVARLRPGVGRSFTASGRPCTCSAVPGTAGGPGAGPRPAPAAACAH